MVNKKQIATGLGMVGLLLLIVGVTLAGTSQSFALFQQQVFIPKYFTGECVTRADNQAEVQIPTHTDDAHWYHCTSDDANKWIPQVSGVQCTYRIEGGLLLVGSTVVSVCKEFTENVADTPLFFSDNDKCTADLSATGNIFTVPAGDSIFIDTDVAFGEAELFVKYPSYGLRMRSADGFVSPTTNTCLLNSIGNEFHTLEAGTRLEIIPDVPFNAVSSLQSAFSSQAVTLQDIESGKPIYISRPGYYHLIDTADDGFVFVDTRKEFANPLIECIPRTTGCSDEAKIVKLVDQSCDQFGGAITGYSPVADNPTKLCKYSCTSGQLKLTSDCIQVQTSCTADKPLWDTTTGQCTATIQETKCPDNLPVGDRILVKKETTTCSGKLLCEVGLTDPEFAEETVCVKPSFFAEFGLIIVILVGIAMVIGAYLYTQKKRR